MAFTQSARDRMARDWKQRSSYGIAFTLRNDYLTPPNGDMYYETSINLGYGLLLRNGKGLFDLSVELGQRSGDDYLPAEKFVRSNFGIQVNEYWFRKAKRR